MRWKIPTGVAFTLLAAVAQADLPLSAELTNQVGRYFELPVGTSNTSIELQISTGTELDVVITSDQVVAVEIEMPGGQIVDPGDLLSTVVSAGETPPIDSMEYREGNRVSFNTQSHAVGVWTVRLTTDGATQTTGSIVARISGGKAAAVMTSRASYPADVPASIGVPVFEGDNAVLNASVVVDVYEWDDSENPIVDDLPLNDDGVNPDVSSNDGLYSELVSGLSPGHYVVAATITSGPDIFVVYGEFSIATSASPAFTGAVGETVQTNADGFVEQVTFEIQRNSFSLEVFQAFVTLRASNGNEITARSAETMLLFDPLVVTFSAADLRQRLGVDGPYDIVSARVWQTGCIPDGAACETGDVDPVIVADFSDVGQTNPYLVNGDGTGQFDLDRPTVALLGFTEQAADLNGDGKYDQLHLSLQLERLVGVTGLGATVNLFSADGTYIESISVFPGTTIGPGLNEVNLFFTGQTIGESGKNGPFRFRNLQLNFAGAPNVIRVSLLGETQFYPYTDFAGSPVDQDDDADGFLNDEDNCTIVFNPDQRDTDGDGYGNFCDPDVAMPNNCSVDFFDVAVVKAAFLTNPSSPAWNADVDFDGSDSVDFFDLAILKEFFFLSPGPSGITTVCDGP